MADTIVNAPKVTVETGLDVLTLMNATMEANFVAVTPRATTFLVHISVSVTQVGLEMGKIVLI